jgi:hypothetical protein
LFQKQQNQSNLKLHLRHIQCKLLGRAPYIQPHHNYLGLSLLNILIKTLRDNHL